MEATAGFGATVITVTLGAYFLPIEEVLAIFVPVNLLLSAWLVARNHRSIDRALLLRRVLPVMGLGVVVGLALFHLRGEGWIKAVFGLFVVALSALELARGSSPPASAPARTVALFASGVVHGLFACGGPLLVWVAGRELPDKGRFRATLSVVWLLLGLVLVANYTLAGTLSLTTLSRSVMLLPPLFVALWVGERVHHRIDPVTFRKAVFVLLLLAGGSLAARTLLA